MFRHNRKRTLIEIATSVLGASSFVASDTFTVGSQGSVGDNCMQVAGVDQATTFDSLEQINVRDGSGGGEADLDSSGGATGGEGDSGDGGGSAPSTSVEVLVDPSAAGGVNNAGSARRGGSIFNTEHVTGKADRYLRGIRNDEINQNATTRIGSLIDTSLGDNVVFLVANVGSEESTNVAPPVTVTMRLLYNGEISSDEQSSFKFPYRVLDADQNTVSSGQDLATASGIELATGEMIEVVTLIDTTNGASDIKLLSGIQFFATE